MLSWRDDRGLCGQIVFSVSVEASELDRSEARCLVRQIHQSVSDVASFPTTAESFRILNVNDSETLLEQNLSHANSKLCFVSCISQRIDIRPQGPWRQQGVTRHGCNIYETNPDVSACHEGAIIYPLDSC